MTTYGLDMTVYWFLYGSVSWGEGAYQGWHQEKKAPKRLGYGGHHTLAKQFWLKDIEGQIELLGLSWI